MLKLKTHAVAGSADNVCVCQNAVAVLVGIENDSTASGIARENATGDPQDAVDFFDGIRIGQDCIGDCSSSGEDDNENSSDGATHSKTSV
ncbi:hypothetical protein [Rubripirellula tenax]|uniref:hypothetical protein n=1 Tax=Rubripirellula tenax TaxID=2528015 RepID=UPI0011B647CE|nr:hypothetical protein [Rubripirellula tenax]